MAYNKTDGFITEKQSNYGFGLTLQASGKAPLIAKRIWDTYDHMMEFVNDANDTAIVGLLLTVTNDSTKNGVYRVKTVGNGVTNGTVEKLSESSDTTQGFETIQNEVDNTQIGAGLNSDGTYSPNTDSNYLSNATSLKDADNKLDTKIKEVDTRITTEIQKLDYTDTAVTNSFVTKVDQEDGIIKTTKVRPTSKDISRTEENGVTGTTVESALVELQQKIDASNTAQRQYKIRKLANSEIDDTIKEAYRIQVKTNGDQDFSDVNDSEIIKIYKDSSIDEIYIGSKNDAIVNNAVVKSDTDQDNQYLNYVYINANGQKSITHVDISKFLTDQEFKDGLQVSSGKVSVKINNSLGVDPYLSVDTNGIKLSGITAALKASKTEIDKVVTISGTTDAHLTITESTSSNGNTVYKFKETDIASKSKLDILSGATLNSVSTSGKIGYVTITVGEKDDNHDQAINASLQMGSVSKSQEGLASAQDVYGFAVNATDLSGSTSGTDYPEWDNILTK